MNEVEWDVTAGLGLSRRCFCPFLLPPAPPPPLLASALAFRLDWGSVSPGLLGGSHMTSAWRGRAEVGSGGENEDQTQALSRHLLPASRQVTWQVALPR